MKICGQWPGLDTGLAANLEKMTTFNDHADRQLLAARPYSTYVGKNTNFVTAHPAFLSPSGAVMTGEQSLNRKGP